MRAVRLPDHHAGVVVEEVPEATVSGLFDAIADLDAGHVRSRTVLVP